jgi:hypothetical protein
MTMAKSKNPVTPKPAPKCTLCNGVGFNPATEQYRTAQSHYVVLMTSIHSGVEVFGPFLTESAAHEWIREHGDGEMYSHFGKTRETGVVFVVKWLDVPVNYERG